MSRPFSQFLGVSAAIDCMSGTGTLCSLMLLASCLQARSFRVPHAVFESINLDVLLAVARVRIHSKRVRSLLVSSKDCVHQDDDLFREKKAGMPHTIWVPCLRVYYSSHSNCFGN